MTDPVASQGTTDEFGEHMDGLESFVEEIKRVEALERQVAQKSRELLDRLGFRHARDDSASLRFVHRRLLAEVVEANNLQQSKRKKERDHGKVMATRLSAKLKRVRETQTE